MRRTARPLQGKKLLMATLGVGTLTFAACSLFPGCNLVAPPQCPNTGGYDCYLTPDLASPLDGNLDAAPGDGSLDAAPKGD
jgi:hypothetical protein